PRCGTERRPTSGRRAIRARARRSRRPRARARPGAATAVKTRADYTGLDMPGAGAENPDVPRVLILLVLVAALGGCKRNPDAPPCGAVGATFFALSKDGLARGTLDSDRELR